MICRFDYDPTAEALRKQLSNTPLYLCDPEKNASCPKTHCGGDECYNTTDIRCAKVGSNGKVIKATLVSIATAVALLFTGCGVVVSNYQYLDTTYHFDEAIISLPDGEVAKGKVKSWRDYEDVSCSFF